MISGLYCIVKQHSKAAPKLGMPRSSTKVVNSSPPLQRPPATSARFLGSVRLIQLSLGFSLGLLDLFCILFVDGEIIIDHPYSDLSASRISFCRCSICSLPSFNFFRQESYFLSFTASSTSAMQSLTFSFCLNCCSCPFERF